MVYANTNATTATLAGKSVRVLFIAVDPLMNNAFKHSILLAIRLYELSSLIAGILMIEMLACRALVKINREPYHTGYQFIQV